MKVLTMLVGGPATLFGLGWLGLHIQPAPFAAYP